MLAMEVFRFKEYLHGVESGLTGQVGITERQKGFRCLKASTHWPILELD